ncbi:hypothetical protein EVAR_88341_1 [Eumeta japonica]|uniref:Uncharacterized protein n=1 Tax=Eumeta variegata TaxID=151549 RepID=A0A4C1YDF4_EUMVA|nr:hypothetical protein EVAR_88341_1 [Eumeta japonica]
MPLNLKRKNRGGQVSGVSAAPAGKQSRRERNFSKPYLRPAAGKPLRGLIKYLRIVPRECVSERASAFCARAPADAGLSLRVMSVAYFPRDLRGEAARQIIPSFAAIPIIRHKNFRESGLAGPLADPAQAYIILDFFPCCIIPYKARSGVRPGVVFPLKGVRFSREPPVFPNKRYVITRRTRG